MISSFLMGAALSVLLTGGRTVRTVLAGLVQYFTEELLTLEVTFDLQLLEAERQLLGAGQQPLREKQQPP